MTTSVIIASGFNALNANLTRYLNLFGNSSFDTTEANKKHNIRPAGVLSNLTVQVTGNGVTAASTLRLRKNGANGNQSVSITASTSGTFTDASNTDSIAVGDDLNYSIVTGATGTNMNFVAYSLVFTPTDTTISSTKFGYNTITAHTTASTTRYVPVTGGGGAGQTTEANVQLKLKKAGTFKFLDARVSANARTTTTTIRSRKNTANGGMSVSVGNSATGEFEDTTNSDTVAVNDLYNYSFTTGTGNQSITIQHISASFESTANVVPLIAGHIGNAISASSTWGVTASANISYAGDTTTSATIIRKEGTISNFLIKVIANATSGSSTGRIRINSVDSSLSVSIGAAATGNFEDNTNTQTIAANDTVHYTHANAAGGTATTVYYCCYLTGLTQVTETNTHKYNIIQQITRTRTHKYNILQKITRTRTHKYHVDTNTIKLVRRNTNSPDGFGKSLTRTTGSDTSITHTVTTALGSLNLEATLDNNILFKKDWPNGNWIVRLRVTDANSNVRLYSGLFQRLSNDATTVRAEKIFPVVDIPLSTTGVYVITVPWDDDSQNPTDRQENDRLYIDLVLANATGSDQDVDIGFNLSNFNDEITTPIPVPTQVTRTRTHKYNILEKITRTRTHKYNILQQITRTRSHLYNIIGRITRTRSHLYNIIGRLYVTKTHKYDIIGRLYVTKTHKYHVIRAVSVTKNHLYNVIGKVILTRTHKYNVIEKVTETNSHLYNIIGKVTRTRTHKYNIIEQIEATKTHKYDIEPPEGTVSTNKTHKYNIEGKVTTTKTHKFNILDQVVETNTHKYHVLEQIEATKSHLYNVIGRIYTTKTHKYNVIRQITAQKVHLYDVLEGLSEVTKNTTHVYNVLARITNTLTHKYNIIAIATRLRTHKYNITATIQQSRTHKFNIIQKITKTWTHKYDVLNRVSPDRTRTHKYNIIAKVIRTRTQKYNIIGRLYVNKTHKYHQGGRVLLTRIHKYDVGSALTLQELGGSTNAYIRFPERVRIIDIIADIRNLAIANVEIITSRPPPHKAIAVVAIAEYSSRLLTASAYKPRHRLASRQIIPQVIDTIDNLAVAPYIGIERVEPTPQSRVQLLSTLQLHNTTPTYLYTTATTQLKQDPNTIIKIASDTEMIQETPSITRIASKAQIEMLPTPKPYTIMAPEIMTKEKKKVLKTFIKLLSSNDLFE